MLGAIVGDIVGSIYEFDVTCQGSVPEAIRCFLEADGFEDAIRNEALGRLDCEMLETYHRFIK